MSHDLSLGQNHAFNLSRTLMAPVTLFEVDGEFGVMPSDELEDADIEVIHGYDPYQVAPAPLAAPQKCRVANACLPPLADQKTCRLRTGDRKGGYAAAGATWRSFFPL